MVSRLLPNMVEEFDGIHLYSSLFDAPSKHSIDVFEVTGFMILSIAHSLVILRQEE